MSPNPLPASNSRRSSVFLDWEKFGVPWLHSADVAEGGRWATGDAI